jgi:hypothetical protein
VITYCPWCHYDGGGWLLPLKSLLSGDHMMLRVHTESSRLTVAVGARASSP